MSEMGCRALIMVVSRTDSIEVTVTRLKPEVVGFIVSQEILAPVVMKCGELGLREPRFRMVDSAMEISDSFGRFEHLLAELEEAGYPPEDVILDATGGTTPMRLGAAFAAMTRGMRMVHQRVPMTYTDNDWKVDPSRPREVFPMGNPLEATGLLREGQAVELFNRRDYTAAALVFEDVGKKVAGVERRHYYRGLLLLSRGYAAWDVADYATALEQLKLALAELDVGYSEAVFSERAYGISARIRSHLAFLGKAQGRKLYIENVVDMVENARRRIMDQDRYDDGVARLYRAVEMWHQWRLQQNHSISTKEVKWDRIDEAARQTFLQRTNLPETPAMLDLVRARALDRILSGESEEEDNVLRDLLQRRNSSILAHGLEPMGEKSARRFLEYVDALVGEREIRDAARHVRLDGL